MRGRRRRGRNRGRRFRVLEAEQTGTALLEESILIVRSLKEVVLVVRSEVVVRIDRGQLIVVHTGSLGAPADACRAGLGGIRAGLAQQ